jgi:hypothetical protein
MRPNRFPIKRFTRKSHLLLGLHLVMMALPVMPALQPCKGQYHVMPCHHPQDKSPLS